MKRQPFRLHKRMIALVIAALFVAGCASAPVAPIVTRVEIPVPVSCLPADLPQRPSLTAAGELRAMSSADYVLTVSAERLDLMAYADELDAVLSGCR